MPGMISGLNSLVNGAKSASSGRESGIHESSSVVGNISTGSCCKTISSRISFFWMVMLCLIIPKAALSQDLNSLISLSQLLAADPPISTNGNVNLIETGEDNSDPIPVCYLPYLYEFTDVNGPTYAGPYQGLVAIFLAMEHLNTGNGTIVPELNNINQRCPLRFVTKAFDTESQRSVAVDHVISMTDRSRTEQLVPCAILGTSWSSLSMPTSMISGLRGFPQISPTSTSPLLDNKSQYKLFGRTIPNDMGTAIPFVAKLISWNVKYVAVLHISDEYGSAFANSIRFVAQRDAPGLRVETVNIADDANDETISKVLQQLKETEFTYFFGIIFPNTFVDRVMMEAYKQGIAGTGRHTWIFSDTVAGVVEDRDFPTGSPLEQAYRGTSVLSAVGGIPGIDKFDKLVKSMQILGENDEDRSYFDAQLPWDDADGKNQSIITSQESFLKAPQIEVPFLYDAVVALGLASCGLVEVSESSEYFTGEELFQALLSTTFEGASGSIIFDPDTGTRDPRSALFSLTNIIDDEDISSDKGKVQFKSVVTDIFKSGEWETIAPFTFNDGASEIPPDLPILKTNTNYLSSGSKSVGSILCCIIIVLALSFSFWTHLNSQQRAVRASQPIFLYIISAGTLLMGASIIPLTIDLGVTDQKGANAACVAYPWLLAIGFSLTFSALFTKTHRINQIMNSGRFKRVTVTAADVMKPMIALLMLNIVVLITWTVIDPRQRQTVVITQDSFLRDVETYDVCSSDHASIFTAIFCVINLGSLLVALLEAYQARNISTELQESSYIFMAMTLILFVSFIGIPVMIIARDNVATFYFVTAGVTFVVCASVLLLIFIPKVQAVMNKKKGSTQTPSASLVSMSSSTEGGMAITNTVMALFDLKKECRELKEENHKLKEENHELGRLSSRANEGRVAQSELEKKNHEQEEGGSHNKSGNPRNSIPENDNASAI